MASYRRRLGGCQGPFFAVGTLFCACSFNNSTLNFVVDVVEIVYISLFLETKGLIEFTTGRDFFASRYCYFLSASTFLHLPDFLLMTQDTNVVGSTRRRSNVVTEKNFFLCLARRRRRTFFACLKISFTHSVTQSASQCFTCYPFPTLSSIRNETTPSHIVYVS